MLKILCGGAGTKKNRIIFDEIVCSAKSQKKICVIVPDQFTFEYDRILYKALGAKLFNSISVVGFSRLADSIINSCGVGRGEYADENAKQIMMYLAIKEFKKNHSESFYKKHLEKSGFISEALELIKDLRHGDISPFDFEAAAAADVSETLKDKLTDLGRIYSIYSEILSQNNLKDSLTKLSEAAQIVGEYKQFDGFDVFVDRFNTFSHDEFNMLKKIIEQAENVTFSLTISGENNSKSRLSPFENVIITRTSLSEIAALAGKKIAIENCVDFVYYKSRAIEHINSNIFYPVNIKSDDDGCVKIVSASDLYSEAEFVASEIKKLVCDDGYRFSEIAVISRDMASYQSVIPSVFGKYEIPIFMDAAQPVTGKALIIFINAIFDALAGKTYKTDVIFRYIKSPLFSYSSNDISRLEDYCLKWNVTGDMWIKDFEAEEFLRNNINILTKKANKATRHHLTRIKIIKSIKTSRYKSINEIRQEIISPLEKFKAVCMSGNTAKICEAFLTLLTEIKLDSFVRTLIYDEDKHKNLSADALEMERQYKQLWEILVSAVSSVHSNIPEHKMSIKEFCELVRTMMSQSKVSNPPQKLDVVTVAGADRSLLADPKIVFVVGTNDGKMPASVGESGFFSDRDIEQLNKAGLKFSQTLLWKMSEERLVAYLALTSPSDKLYVSYPNSDTAGKTLRAGIIIKQLLAMFGHNSFIDSSKLETAFFCKTLPTAFQKISENFKSKDPEIEAIKKLVYENHDYKQKLDYISTFSHKKQFKLIESNSRELFVTNNLRSSATRIENYFKCPFSYFCQYGLRLKSVQPIEVNPLSRGNFVHFCMEEILSETVDGKKVYNENFLTLTFEELEEKVASLKKAFFKQELGGDFGKTERFKVLFNNLGKMVLDLALNIQSEFKEGKFRPAQFEYNLENADGKSIYQLFLEDGTKIELSGKIDRIDTFENSDAKYLRIIDYKTGKKDLLFDEIFNGLNLQMILYLSALTKGDGEFNGFLPAGVLYMPSNYLDLKITRDSSTDDESLETKIQENKLNHFKMKGLITQIDETIKAMEDEIKGKFIPVKTNKDKSYAKSSSLISKESLAQLQEFANEKVKEMATGLINGEIKAVPTERQNKTPCDYCEYWTICGNSHPDEKNIISKQDGIELKMLIETDEKGSESDGKSVD